MRTLIGVLVSLLGASLAYAQAPPTTQSPAYRYVDEHGVIHWAQSIHVIPERYASKAVTPDFRDPSLFPTPGPYVKPATPSALVVTLPHETRLKPAHARYVNEVRRIVTAAWKGRGQDGPQPALSFYIARDGRVSIPDVERSSGSFAYDLKARDTIMSLRRLPPLPPDIAGAQLRVQLKFAFVK